MDFEVSVAGRRCGGYEERTFCYLRDLMTIWLLFFAFQVLNYLGDPTGSNHLSIRGVNRIPRPPPPPPPPLLRYVHKEPPCPASAIGYRPSTCYPPPTMVDDPIIRKPPYARITASASTTQRTIIAALLRSLHHIYLYRRLIPVAKTSGASTKSIC